MQNTQASLHQALKAVLQLSIFNFQFKRGEQYGKHR